LDVDGLTHWKEKPISTDLWNCFEDVRSRLQMPLVIYLRRKKKPINVTFKLSALGADLESAVFWIVILCPEKSSKRTKKFVEERKARRFVRGNSPGQVTLGIKVVSSPLIPTGTKDILKVFGTVCKELGCASISFRYDDRSHYGTLGGCIRIVDADDNQHIYGLTSNHIFQSAITSEDLFTSERDSDSDSSSGSDTSDSDFSHLDGTESEESATRQPPNEQVADDVAFDSKGNRVNLSDRRSSSSDMRITAESDPPKYPRRPFNDHSKHPRRQYSPNRPIWHIKRARLSDDVTTQSSRSSPDTDGQTKLEHNTMHKQVRAELDTHHVQDEDLLKSIVIKADLPGLDPGTRLASHSDTPMAQVKSAPESIEEEQSSTWPHLGKVLPVYRSPEAQNRDWALVEYLEKPERHLDTYQPPWKDYEGAVLDLDPTAAPLDVLLLQPDFLYACRLSHLPAYSVLPFGQEVVMTYPVSFGEASCKSLVTRP
jgi:hypothetical protein